MKRGNYDLHTHIIPCRCFSYSPISAACGGDVMKFWNPFKSPSHTTAINAKASRETVTATVVHVDRKPKPSITDPKHTQLQKEVDELRKAGLL